MINPVQSRSQTKPHLKAMQDVLPEVSKKLLHPHIETLTQTSQDITRYHMSLKCTILLLQYNTKTTNITRSKKLK